MRLTYDDNFYAATLEEVENAAGAGTEVEDTGIDLKHCREGVLLVNVTAIAGGSLVVQLETSDALAGTYADVLSSDETITATGLYAYELKDMKRYGRLVFTDSAHAKTWVAMVVGWNCPMVPVS